MCSVESRKSDRSRRGLRVLFGVVLAVVTASAAGQSELHNESGPGTFGRIFHLPPFAAPSPEITAALLELGKRGGLMDAHDDLAAGPIALIVDPALSRINRDNDQHTAGLTFFGQFLDHDMTFDTTSRLGEPTSPRTAPNARSPYFDLDSVYGDGPAGSPLLYFPGFEDDVRPNKRIDTLLSTPLFDLPLGAIPAGAPPTSLAQRNLLRHLTWRIPSGQSIAAAVGAPMLTERDFTELWSIHPQFVKSTPLWYYVLKEAEIFEDGRHLGPAGGRIVAEVFIGLLRTDPEGFLTRQPDFTPSLGILPGEFHITDLVTFAGVAGKR